MTHPTQPAGVPRPGTTVQVPLPGAPTEQGATNWAIQSGKLLAVVILIALAIWFLKWLFGSVQMKVILAIIVTGFVAYMVWGRH